MITEPPKYDDTSARREILERNTLSSLQLWSIGNALDKKGQPLEGVPAQLVAELLLAPWPTSRGGDGASYESKQAAAWTFQPSKLVADDERSLTSLAIRASSSLVKARINDVLHERFRKPIYARNAVYYLLDCIERYLGEDDWPSLDAWCARALQLAAMLRDTFVARQTLQAHADASAAVLRLPHCFAFSRFALRLTEKSNRYFVALKLVTPATLARWTDTIDLLAAWMQLNGHWPNVQQVREHQAALCLFAGDQVRRTKVLRTLVEESLLEAAARPDVATICIQRAMSLSSDHGFRDLLDRCKVALQAAIKAESARMKGQPVDINVSGDAIKHVLEILGRAPGVPTAIRTLASMPDFVHMPIKEYEKAATDALSESPLLAMIPSATFRANKISLTADISDPKSKIKEVLSMYGQIHLAQVEALLLAFLRAAFRREVAADVLVQATRRPDWLGEERFALLVQASQHFAKQEWFSSGILLAIAYEGVLRDLLRATGYAALKYSTDGTTSDELLNSLAWSRAAEELLGLPYLALMRFLLCDPELGANLRNEIAHANALPGALPPQRVLLIALLLVHLTLFEPTAPATEAGGAEVGEEEVDDRAEDKEPT